jgi:sporulation protein YlmC with PRC-barrel domain
MARVLLSNTDDWKLKFEEQDVRGRTAYDASGDAVGTVDDMIVDTDARRVTAIRLDDGREFPAHDITIADGAVYLSRDLPEGVAETVTVYDDYGHVVEREAVGAAGAAGAAGYDAYASDFQSHHGSTYAESGRDYTAYEPAYRYGYESAGHDPFRDRDYGEVESDLRSRYTERHPDRDYDADREAIRYGYTRARTS